MSETKPVPVIGLDNLIPPYETYKFFADGDEKRLRVDDARHGFNRKAGGAASPFDREAKDFRMVNAWWLADASTLVYDDPPRVRDEFLAAGFTRVEFTGSALENRLGKDDTQCFVASNDDLAVVAFRGTESGLRPAERTAGRPDFTHIFNDIVTDARFKLVLFDDADASKGRVHEGFKRALDDVWDELSSHLRELNDGRRAFWITGHSLGAALAVLAAARCDSLPDFDMHGLYTYGNPLTGDKDFVSHLGGVLAKHGMGYFRFVNNRDIVTVVPPESFGFRHAGTLKFINSDGEIGDGVGPLKSVVNFAGGVLRRSFDVFGTINSLVARLIPEQLKDHVPTLYATHIWNAHVDESN